MKSTAFRILFSFIISLIVYVPIVYSTIWWSVRYLSDEATFIIAPFIGILSLIPLHYALKFLEKRFY